MPVAPPKLVSHALLRSILINFVRRSLGASLAFSTRTVNSSYRLLVMERKQGTFIDSIWKVSSRACRRRIRCLSRCSSRPRPLVSSFTTGKRKGPQIQPSSYSMKSSCPRRTVESLVSFRSPVCFCIPSLPAGVWYLTLRLQRRIIFKTRLSIPGVPSVAGQQARGIRQRAELRAVGVCFPLSFLFIYIFV